MSFRRVRMSATIAIAALAASLAWGTVAASASSLPPIKHVFIIVLENESESTSFGASSPAPYLAQTLKSQGAFVPNYYGIGHSSLDNYIAMIGGQPPNPTTQGDCPTFANMADSTSSYGAVTGSGCLYPADTPTIVNQLAAKGLTWGAYMDEMGLDPAREAATCPAPVAGNADNTESAETSAPYDEYAERHDPFMYYHSITDDTASCQAHVVSLGPADGSTAGLAHDLQSVSTTPNYVFVTPDLCNDGHNTAPNCGPGEPGGLTQVNSFLQTWVPKILASPAYQQDGLLLITFDEAASGDSSACCGELPGPAAANPGGSGPGGGQVGAVLLSPFIKAGTVTSTAYNHYSMLGSIEDLFGLTHLGYAQLPGETDFGADIYTNYTIPIVCSTPQIAGSSCTAPQTHPFPTGHIATPTAVWRVSTKPKVTLLLSGTAASGFSVRSYKVQSHDLSVKNAFWKPVGGAVTGSSVTFSGTLGHTYEFRIAATDSGGETGSVTTTGPVVIPSGVKPAKGHYSKHWKTVKVRNAWEGHAIRSSTPGATFTLRYTGGGLALIGETSKQGGRLKITLDGHSRTVRLHSSKLAVRKQLASLAAATGTHHLTLTVLSGTVAIEGYAITERTS